MSISTGGLSGDNALLAFAAAQQTQMNHELSDAMRVAEVRSHMAKDISNIKAHLLEANSKNPNGIADVKKELDAFKAEYGADPACADMMEAIEPMHKDITLRVNNTEIVNKVMAAQRYVAVAAGNPDLAAQMSDYPIVAYQKDQLDHWLNNIQEVLDAAGTSDQLAMVHMKQLNDNINNSSGMVSGIIESRQNVLSQIINNFA
ncbi:MAG: hypothetical protein K0R38_5513 [Polyangiaceae bacterium]|nr:hypothetical protein [Polyangiaceae bacterium]